MCFKDSSDDNYPPPRHHGYSGYNGVPQLHYQDRNKKAGKAYHKKKRGHGITGPVAVAANYGGGGGC